MSNFKIKIDMKKFEKDLNKQLEKIVYEQQKELMLKNKIEKGDDEMITKKYAFWPKRYI